MTILVYPLTENEKNQLLMLNTSELVYIPCSYDEIMFSIEKETLDNPLFFQYKNLFDIFPPREPVEVTLNPFPF